MYDLIIVGSGPAGMAAAVYAARKRLNTVLIAGDIGGQINWTSSVENYLGFQLIEGYELISKFQQQVDQFPIDKKIGDMVTRIIKVKDSFEAITDKNEIIHGKTVLIATGKRPRRLNVSGEAELLGRGVSYCAVCDGPVFAGQKIVVIGGGNSALEAVLDLLVIAEHIALVSSTPLTADQILIDRMSGAKNLTTYLGYQVKEIIGQKLVEGIVIEGPEGTETLKLDVKGVFIEIGLSPNSELVKGLVALNHVGEIIVDCLNETNVPGIVAAGDVTTVPEKQIAVAVGEGAKAALRAHRYLQRL
jgi:alkyl hydroperoxide reductase subunit F